MTTQTTPTTEAGRSLADGEQDGLTDLIVEIEREAKTQPPDRAKLVAAFHRLHADQPRRSTRAPSRWTEEMFVRFAEQEADALLAAWPSPERDPLEDPTSVYEAQGHDR